MDLSTAIRVAMAKRNLNQTKLSEITGINQSHISLILRDKVEVKLATVKRFAEAADMPLSEFIKLGE